MVSTGNAIRILFHTDTSTVEGGFKIQAEAYDGVDSTFPTMPTFPSIPTHSPNSSNWPTWPPGTGNGTLPTIPTMPTIPTVPTMGPNSSTPNKVNCEVTMQIVVHNAAQVVVQMRKLTNGVVEIVNG